MGSMVGASVVRKEDPALLTGHGRFVDDIAPPGTVHLAVVRSHHAHARILSVDSDEATALPGVLGVWTAADLEGLPPQRCAPGLIRPCLATGKVRFVGEPVAVVVAGDRYVAADAASAVIVEYEDLPALASIEAAMAEGAEPILDGLPGNVLLEQQLSADDAEAELAAAPHRLQLQLRNQRCAAVPIEPTACLADWGPSGLTLYLTSQAPHHKRNEIARMFDLPQHQVRLVAPDVGGGFGAKASFYPEFLLTSELSRRLGRPVKFVETRSENMVAMVHGRAQRQDIDVGYDDEGRIQALRVQILQDGGAWPDQGVGLPTLTSFMSGGCYKIPTIAPSFRSVLTHTTPIGAYRGAGRPEAAYLIERVMDRVAAELGIDPVEIRRRNFIQPGDMPYATQFEGIVYDEADYPAALDLLLDKIDYQELRAEQKARRDDPAAPLLGIGFSSFVEMGGFGPTPLFEQFGYVGGWESANIRLNTDGSAVVSVGTSPHGQGHETAFAQLVSDVLSVPMDRITVLHGDTATVQEGIGTMGSRGIPVGGAAVHKAAGRVKDKAVQIAAHLLEADPSDIELADGRFSVRGAADSAGVDLAEVAMTSFKPHKLPEGFDLGLDETAFYEPTNLSYPSGAHCCVVEVDRDTGRVTVQRYIAVDDCGVVINPLMARGQIHGGVAQGIAQALIEEMAFSEDGQPITATLVDYTLPAAPDLPRYETDHLETRTSFNPLGAKGLGESGATGAPQAVVNAVVDALSHLGVRTIDMPCTPQKVWRTLQDANGSGQ